MLKKLLLGPAAALVLLYVSAAPALASSEVGHGSLFLDGVVVGTVVPPAQLPAGTGQDPFYKVTNGASGQLGIAAGDITVTRVPGADFRCPITQQN